MRERLRSGRLVATGVLGLLLLNYPIISLLDLNARVLGVPLLWVYLFAVWTVLIALFAVITRKVD